MIKIEDLLPLLKKGWVAMDAGGLWWWYDGKPFIITDGWNYPGSAVSFEMFDLAPYEGDWKDSLMECGK